MERSFTKTRSNNVTEKEAVAFLIASDPCYQVLPVALKNRLLQLLGVEKEFSNRVFDLVRSETPIPPLDAAALEHLFPTLLLIEAKSTKKKVRDETQHGFFFGATANEYRAAERLAPRYKFAFVVLNSENALGRPFHVLLDHEELEARTRVQYQVNLGPRRQ